MTSSRPCYPKYLFARLAEGLAEGTVGDLVCANVGSGSTVFEIVESETEGETLRGRLGKEFGKQTWSAVCPLNPGSDPIS